MFPDKHFEDLESSRRRRKIALHAGGAVAFVASFLLLGQAVHELMHLIPLELIGCPYRFDAGFTLLNGLHASAQPLCAPGRGFLLIFYPLGYLSTLVAGWGLLLAARNSVSKLRYSLLAASGTGMLLSMLLTAGAEGDIESFVAVAGLDSAATAPLAAGLILLVVAVSFSGVKMLLEA
ncbi:MAG: hypothetical protein ABEJ91_01135 [Candidatus Nanohaloarchaea archaeon]